MLKSDISCVAVAAALDMNQERAGSLSKNNTGVLLHSKSYWYPSWPQWWPMLLPSEIVIGFTKLPFPIILGCNVYCLNILRLYSASLT